MADDINKKITIDVQVNSDDLQQLDKYSGAVTNLNASVAKLSDGLSKTHGEINTISESATKIAADGAKQVEQINTSINGFIKSLKSFGESVGTTFSNSFKSIFSNVIGYFKKPLKETSDAQVKSNSETNKQVGDNTKASQDATNKNTLATTQATNNQLVANAKATQDKIRASEIESTQKMADSVFSIMTKSNDAVRDRAILNDEKARKDELKADGDNKAAIAATNQKYDTLENNAKKKAFKADQNVARAQAIMNGAIAITKAEAQLGPIAGTLAIAAIVAQTAAQLAIISKQQPPALAKGGYFRSDGKGAVLPSYSRTDNTNAFLRSGEAVVVSEAMRDPWARNLVSAINVAFGGRDFSVPNPARGYAVGGIFSDGGNANRYYNQPMNDNKNLANTIAYQMINNFPPVYVDVKDINNQQNILAQTVNRVNL